LLRQELLMKMVKMMCFGFQELIDKTCLKGLLRGIM
jgi:hypothetical protein